MIKQTLFICSLLPAIAFAQQDNFRSVLANGQWRIEKETAGFLGCGPDAANSADWYAANPNQDILSAMFDDRLTFTADGKYTYAPGADGLIMVNKSVTDAPFGSYNPKNDNDYTAKVSQQATTYALEEDGGYNYITFPKGTLLPYISSNSQLSNPRFRVYSNDDHHLKLRYEGEGIVWQLLLTNYGDIHTISPSTIVGDNLWHPANPTINFWYSDSSWSLVDNPGFTNDNGNYTLYLHTETIDQWQAQMYLTNTGLSLSSSKQYAISMEVATDKDVPMTVKLSDPGNDYDFCYYDIRTISAGTTKYISEVFSGIDCNNVRVNFDFGGCLAGTTVSIKNIVIGEAVPASSDEPIAEEVKTGDVIIKTIDGNNWNFLVTDAGKKTCELVEVGEVGYRWYITSVSIPSDVGGFALTSIGKKVFYGLPLTTLEIPSSVKEVGEYAFGNCRNLTTVKLNEGLEIIGAGAFENLISVKSWELPASLKEIRSEAFYCWEQPAWESVTVKNTTPLNISADVFYYFSDYGEEPKTTTLYVPSGTKSLYEMTPVWSDFTLIKEIGNPDDTGEHAHGFFSGENADGILFSAHVNGPGTCAIISQNAAQPSSGYSPDYSQPLAAIPATTEGVLNIPSSIKGYTVTEIGQRAFTNCSKLTEIILPNTVKKLNNFSLSAPNVKEIYIPASVTVISPLTFVAEGQNSEGFWELKTPIDRLTIDPQNTVYDSRDNCNAVIETATDVLVAGLNTTVIPSSVWAIGYQAFYGRTGLTEMVIPNSVKIIGAYAFSDCKSLKNVDLSNQLEIINNGTFYHCTNLETVILHEGIERIDLLAFCETKISNIKFPKSLKTIENSAFSECTDLVAAVLPEGLTLLGNYAFMGCSKLQSVTIPSTLTTGPWWGYGSMTFANCPNLKTVVSRITVPFNIDVDNFTIYNYEYDEDWNIINREETFTSATLCVPQGTRDKYLATDGWREFKTIVEGEPTGIAAVKAETAGSKTAVYNLAGQRIAGDNKSLPRGIYIINGKKVLSK